MLFLNPVSLATFLFELRISALSTELRISVPFPIQARSVLELKVCSYCLDIVQDQLNVTLSM